MKEVLCAKIHNATVTEARLDYIGSITIDPILIKAAKIIPGEKVQVLNVSNGERLETYVIEGNQEGQIGINGPAALKMKKGDIVIIVSYAFIEHDLANQHTPTIIFPNEKTNRLD